VKSEYRKKEGKFGVMVIRGIELSDAANFLQLCKTLDEETPFMMLEPGERNTTVEQQSQMIRELNQTKRSLILVCEIDGKLVGYLSAFREKYRRKRHCVYIVIGILNRFTKRGIGTQLFDRLEQWGEAEKIHRLELTVMVHNTAAIALYKKIGFQIEGIKRHSLLVDRTFVDEYDMAKLI
jgi:RimJ/RimL family protein N-acetyltransferase